MEQAPNSSTNSEALPPGTAPGGEPEKPRGFRAWFAHAFAVDPYDESSLSEDEKAMLDRVADGIHAKGMSAAAITWAESNRNMNFMGSQALVFANPLYDLGKGYLNAFLKLLGLGGKTNLLMSAEELNTLAMALEKRYSIEYFVQRLEKLEAEGQLTRKAAREAAASEAEAEEAAESEAEEKPDS